MYYVVTVVHGTVLLLPTAFLAMSLIWQKIRQEWSLGEMAGTLLHSRFSPLTNHQLHVAGFGLHAFSTVQHLWRLSRLNLNPAGKWIEHGPVWAPGNTVPLIHLLILALYISFVCLHCMLPHLSFFFAFSLITFAFENRLAPFPDQRS